jgi:hypothetical protein
VERHLNPHLLRTLVIVVRTCSEVSRTKTAQACATGKSPFPPSPPHLLRSLLRGDGAADMRAGV